MLIRLTACSEGRPTNYVNEVHPETDTDVEVLEPNRFVNYFSITHQMLFDQMEDFPSFRVDESYTGVPIVQINQKIQGRGDSAGDNDFYLISLPESTTYNMKFLTHSSSWSRWNISIRNISQTTRYMQNKFTIGAYHRAVDNRLVLDNNVYLEAGRYIVKVRTPSDANRLIYRGNYPGEDYTFVIQKTSRVQAYIEQRRREHAQRYPALQPISPSADYEEDNIYYFIDNNTTYNATTAHSYSNGRSSD